MQRACFSPSWLSESYTAWTEAASEVKGMAGVHIISQEPNQPATSSVKREKEIVTVMEWGMGQGGLASFWSRLARPLLLSPWYQQPVGPE